MNSNVTVLADETLGGVLREFKRVERDAEKGEKIEIIAIHPNSLKVGEVSIGEVFTVKYHDPAGDVYYVNERSFRGIVSNNWEGLREYVVLEPTDVVQIDGERFQMVERKATVGERVIVSEIAYKHREDETLRVGQVGKCTRVLHGSFEGDIDTDLDHDSDGYLNHLRVEYKVLTPVIEIPSVVYAKDSAHSLRADLDNLESGVADEVAELRERIAALEARVFAGKVPAEPVAPKSPQQIRDEIVERAKADLEKLRGGDQASGKYIYGQYGVNADFIVDREKRTVVCLLRGFYIPSIYSRGIAKAAPNDIFNAHIGKAIALRRALGLEVPAEYLSVPNPMEFRVGDVIGASTILGRAYYQTVVKIEGTKLYGNVDDYGDIWNTRHFTYSNSGDKYGGPVKNPVIIDDTREGAEQSVSSTKGAFAA